MQAPRDEAALADWEGDGGSSRPAPRDLVGGPSDPLDRREATFRIGRDLSYLGLSWMTCGGTPDARAAGERMSYAEARSMWHPHLTIERFSFFVRMRDAFRGLRQLRAAER